MFVFRTTVLDVFQGAVESGQYWSGFVTERINLVLLRIEFHAKGLQVLADAFAHAYLVLANASKGQWLEYTVNKKTRKKRCDNSL